MSFGRPAPVDSGRLLLGEANCAACHPASEAIRERILFRAAPNLEGIGKRVTPQHLRAFLDHPAKTRPGTAMPDLLHRIPEPERASIIEDLVHFLVSLGGADWPSPVAANPDSVRRGEATFHSVGCVPCHGPWTAADSAGGAGPASSSSILSDWTTLSLDRIDRKSNVPTVAASILHPPGRMPSFDLSTEDATAIAMYLLRNQIAPAPDGVDRYLTPRDREPFEWKTERAADGRRHFREFGCAQCHTVGDTSIAAPARADSAGRALADLADFGTAGCLAESVPARAPDYSLDAAQRDSLRHALGEINSESRDSGNDAESFITHAMAWFRCYACHSRNGFGGPDRERQRYFATLTPADMDLGIEGRIPPHLTRIGAKLQLEAIHSALTPRGKSRRSGFT